MIQNKKEKKPKIIFMNVSPKILVVERKIMVRRNNLYKTKDNLESMGLYQISIYGHTVEAALGDQFGPDKK
jgi:hypothetical protein